jgi:hypothetical protein
MWVSLLGTFLCVAVMFLMDWVTALITFGVVGILYFYINYRKPGTVYVIRDNCGNIFISANNPFNLLK